MSNRSKSHRIGSNICIDKTQVLNLNWTSSYDIKGKTVVLYRSWLCQQQAKIPRIFFGRPRFFGFATGARSASRPSPSASPPSDVLATRPTSWTSSAKMFYILSATSQALTMLIIFPSQVSTIFIKKVTPWLSRIVAHTLWPPEAKLPSHRQIATQKVLPHTTTPWI